MADWASRGRVAASCIATAMAAAFTTGATAEPASPGSGTALLAYVDARGGLCAMRADGSHRLRLLRSQPPINAPTWSADGRYVAFGRAGKIVVADSRGRVRWQFGDGRSDGRPLWSPDGRHIAYSFVTAYFVGLAVARRDGSDEHEIPPSAPGLLPPDEPSEPAWTPDGRRLAFNDQGSTKAPQGIYSVNVDGSDRRLLVAHAIAPAFSPDGSKLAYVAVSDSGAGFGGIYVADADGSNPHALTLSTKDTAPAWSPDGKHIAFQRGDAIVVVNADGSNERVIASATSWPYLSTPLWSPDSKLIAFTRHPTSVVGNRPFTSSIVVARADGGSERVVLRRRSTVPVQDPAWRPATALPRANRLPCAAPS